MKRIPLPSSRESPFKKNVDFEKFRGFTVYLFGRFIISLAMVEARVACLPTSLSFSSYNQEGETKRNVSSQLIYTLLPAVASRNLNSCLRWAVSFIL